MTQDELQRMADDLNSAVAPVVATIQDVADALAQAFDDFAAAMRPTVEQCVDAIRPLYDAIHAQYIAEGGIYGDTHEGMMRWLEERGGNESA